MAYRLVIADIVKVPVKLTINNAGKPATFAFQLVCERRTQEQFRESMASGQTVKDLLRAVTRDWEGQTLVVDDDGKPVDFNAEAFSLMLDVAGAATLIGERYFQESGAKEKN